jgi:hypothetical protein
VLTSPELAGGGSGDLILISAGDLLPSRNLVFNIINSFGALETVK